MINHKYYFKKTIEEIKKDNRFFMTYGDNNKEIFEEICDIIEQYKCSIMEESKKIILKN